MTSGAVTRLGEISARIDAACREHGRDPETVTLVAVSKTFSADDIRPVLAAGQRVFGENRVQEAQGKWPLLRADFRGIELHLIGPLQSNKAAQAVALFDVIETVDREKIARAIAAEMKAQARQLRLYVQVNIGEEPQKAGINPEDTGTFLAFCRDELGLAIEGLMCIPPANESPETYFEHLATLAKDHGLRRLSMGMSGDFEAAIASGATSVRVGSAIFGSR